MAKTAAKTATVKKTSAALEKKRQEKALQICESSRAQLILQHPFVGRLGIQIPFFPVNDSRIHTIATNGKVHEHLRQILLSGDVSLLDKEEPV